MMFNQGLHGPNTKSIYKLMKYHIAISKTLCEFCKTNLKNNIACDENPISILFNDL